MIRRMTMGLMVGALALWAAPAEGQVAWDAPMLVSPASPSGWGIFLSDPAPGSGLGGLVTWHGAGQTGFRLGVAEAPGESVSFHGGIDLSGSLIRRSQNFPLDVDWVTGVGAGVGDAVLLAFPLGMSFGRAIQGDGVWLNPYVSPRMTLDAWMGSDRPTDELELGFVVDLGVDLAFQENWGIRFGGSIGDREALAIGVNVR